MKVKQVYIRGGAWNPDNWRVHCAYRYKRSPGVRDGPIGFRCCFSLISVIKKG